MTNVYVGESEQTRIVGAEDGSSDPTVGEGDGGGVTALLGACDKQLLHESRHSSSTIDP